MRRTTSLILAAAMILGLMFSAAATTPELTEDQIEAIRAALEDDSKELPIDEVFRVPVSPNDLSDVKGLDEDWMNILLLGTDTGNYSLNYGRTDTMIIMSVNKASGKMRLASLVRDMQVNIPFYDMLNKINTANAFGGPLLAMKTVNETFGLNIRHYVSINFNGFVDVIDKLGGVDLVLEGGEAGIIGVSYSQNARTLNGEQALKYVRIRSLDNNFGRNERQRKLLSSLFDKMLSGGDLQKTMSALTEALKHMATNLSINDLMTLVIPVFTGMEDMDTAGFPAEGDWHYETSEAAQSMVVFDEEITSQKLHNYIYNGIFP